MTKDRTEYIGIYVTKEIDKRIKAVGSDEKKIKIFEEYLETIEKNQ